MYMMDNRDVGGDRDCALEVHVWLISWVGSEHILPCTVGHKQGLWLITWVTQLSLCQAGSISCLPMMLTELEMSRLMCKHFFLVYFVLAQVMGYLCFGTQLLSTHMVWNAGENWVWVGSIDEINLRHLLGFTLPLFNLPISVLPCGTPAQKEQQNCVRTLLEGLKGNLSVWAVPASCKWREDPWDGDIHSSVWPHRKKAPLTQIGKHSLQSVRSIYRFRFHSALKTCHF